MSALEALAMAAVIGWIVAGFAIAEAHTQRKLKETWERLHADAFAGWERALKQTNDVICVLARRSGGAA